MYSFLNFVLNDSIPKLQLYVPLNIFIVLIGIVVWNEQNEVDLSIGENMLKNFLQYRREILVKEHPNDNAQLLTEERFGGNVIGSNLRLNPCGLFFLLNLLSSR